MIELTYNEQRLFTRFEDAAMHDQRAPSAQATIDEGLGNPRRLVDCLIRKGYIESRNYGRNWRVVFILRGPHKGEHTKMSPNGWLEHANSIKRRLDNDMRAVEKGRGL